MARLLRGARTATSAAPLDLIIEDGIITSVTPSSGGVDDSDPSLIAVPGLVDMHVHGGGGASFDALDADEIRAAAAFHHRHGTTTMLASVVTAPSDRLRRSCALLGGLVDADVVAGIHLEGPFLAATRCGAQDPASIIPPSVELIEQLWQDADGHVAMVTIACEQPGALDVIRWCVEHGVIAAIGHTDADADATRRAIDAGATVATHLFNAMPPLHHRDPGPIGVLLTDPRVTCELICDGHHIAAEIARLVIAAAGPRRVAAVTDAIAASGLGDGAHALGGLDVEIRDGVARLAETGALAGSTTTMAASLRRLATWGVALPDAVAIHSTTPARHLGIRAELTEGARADLLMLDRDLRLHGVLRAGILQPGSALTDASNAVPP